MPHDPIARRGQLAADWGGYRYLPAIKAGLLRRFGRQRETADAYRAALDLLDNGAEISPPASPKPSTADRVARRSGWTTRPGAW
ncbi:hypothetical protein [Micromonospora coerulea]|uniref:hypothetical protein n=1 Tax=Micromonospora coerulea TaxID=47856 RepID=UPI001902D282